MSFRPPPPEPVVIDGPAGALAGIVEDPGAVEDPGVVEDPRAVDNPEFEGVPGAALRRGFAVICHPHPLHGGTMQNKVVHTLARAFQEAGYASVRFNYRGVGTSDGQYDEGRGETCDALAVVAWARRRWPAVPMALAGFSFGALIALRAAAVSTPALLISVAPAVSRGDYNEIVRPDCPWLIVQGDADELVDYREVQTFAARFAPPPELRLLPGVGHFFHGQLQQLRALLRPVLD